MECKRCSRDYFNDKKEVNKMTEKKKEKEQNERKPQNGIVYIGNKPFMNYVTSCVMQFTNSGQDTVTIKCRGKFISKGCDVSQVASKRFLKGQIEIIDIKMDSEQFQNKEGKDVRVTCMDIVMKKIKKK